MGMPRRAASARQPERSPWAENAFGSRPEATSLLEDHVDALTIEPPPAQAAEPVDGPDHGALAKAGQGDPLLDGGGRPADQEYALAVVAVARLGAAQAPLEAGRGGAGPSESSARRAISRRDRSPTRRRRDLRAPPTAGHERRLE